MVSLPQHGMLAVAIPIPRPVKQRTLSRYSQVDHYQTRFRHQRGWISLADPSPQSQKALIRILEVLVGLLSQEINSQAMFTNEKQEFWAQGIHLSALSNIGFRAQTMPFKQTSDHSRFDAIHAFPLSTSIVERVFFIEARVIDSIPDLRPPYLRQRFRT